LIINDIYGHFLKDYYAGNHQIQVLLHNHYGPPEDMPVEIFFRKEEYMPDIEVFALNLCKGKILDIGAGTGGHCLLLQKFGFDATAIELSAGACEVMKLRGVEKIINADVMTFEGEKFDTLLLMMNGIGFCQYEDKLVPFLNHAKKLLNPNGQIIFDSSDVAYLYDDEPPEEGSYYGEVDYQYEYNGNKGEWFSWLYADAKLMNKVAKECGYKMQVVFEDDDDHYLAILSLI
jgi:SAM-dependent methyltransferase